MYSMDSLIGKIYHDLETDGDYIFFVNPKEESEYFAYLEGLKRKMNIPEDVYYKARDVDTDAMLANEIKGFISGIYFALKMKEEFKEEMEKIEEYIEFGD